MSFDWKQLLVLSRMLYNTGTKQADPNLAKAVFRTAVNRAYYAAYNIAVEEGKKGVPRLSIIMSRSHSDVIEFYKNDPRPNVQSVGLDLERLFEIRKEADYKSRDKPFKVESELAITFAENIISSLRP